MSSGDKQGELIRRAEALLARHGDGAEWFTTDGDDSFDVLNMAQELLDALKASASSSFDAIDRNRALDEAVAVADAEWVAQNSLAGSKVARKIADGIRALKGTPLPESGRQNCTCYTLPHERDCGIVRGITVDGRHV